MNYQDFQTLSDLEYQIINQAYNANRPKDRRSIIFSISKNINDTLLSCHKTEKNFNKKICSSIHQAKDCLLKLSNNLTELFNIPPKSNLEATNFNLFTFIKKISKISSLYLEWLSFEEKEYYKQQAQKSLYELLNCIHNLMSTLEQSDIRFFRHM